MGVLLAGRCGSVCPRSKTPPLAGWQRACQGQWAQDLSCEGPDTHKKATAPRATPPAQLPALQLLLVLDQL